MREHFTQKDNCRVFLKEIEHAFGGGNAKLPPAFNVEANAGAPLKTEPLPHALTKRLSRKPMGLFVSALRDDLSNIFRQTERKQMPTTNGRKSTDLGATAGLTTAPLTFDVVMSNGLIRRKERDKEERRFSDCSTIRTLIAARRRFQSSSRFTIIQPIFSNALKASRTLRPRRFLAKSRW